MQRGDMWWADVPGDQRRPVVILSRQRFIERLSAILVAPVTSSVRGIPTEVALGPADGMRRRCAINFDNTFTLRVERCVERITTLSPEKMDEVCFAYRFAAGC